MMKISDLIVLSAICFTILNGCQTGTEGRNGTKTVGLTTDQLVAPANIGAKPVFGWKMLSDREGARQTAYRLKVLDPKADNATVWDSGKVACEKSVGIVYAGPALKSAYRYRWEVQALDETGVWLKPARDTFETGFISEEEWKGSVWISAVDSKVRPNGAVTPHGGRNEKQEAEDGTSCFVKTLKNDRSVKEAFWTVAGLGVFEAYVNGYPVSRVRGKHVVRDFLKPGFTHNGKTKYSFTYDVTHLMKKGVNAVNTFSAQVSAGWWRDKIVNFYGRKSAFRAQLIVRYEDGTECRFGTDTTWLSAVAGPVIRAAIFDGEDYDARQSTAWMKGRTDASFKASEVNLEYKGALFPMRGGTVQLRRDRAFAPKKMYVWSGIEGADKDSHGCVKKIRSYRDGDEIALAKDETLIVDFAQNAAAVPEFTFRAEKGTVLTVRPAEMLNDQNGAKNRGNDGPDGSAYRENLRRARATITYTFAGRRQENYHPEFSFFGYRYLSITATDAVTFRRIRSLPVTSIQRNGETGSLTTGEKDVNQLISNVKWGQYSNYLSVPTDCPQRNERLGWTADTQVFCEAATYNANVYGFFLKWMRDMRDTQFPDGSYPGVAPSAQYGGREHQLGWADAGVIVPYTMWKQFGDTTIVEENWDSMMKFLRDIDKTEYASPAALGHQWADWLSYEKLETCGGGVYEPNPDGKGRRVKADGLTYWRYLGGCYWLWDARMLATMADAIGRKEDAADCRAMEARALAYLRKNFIDTGDGLLIPLFRDMQTPALFALKLGILTDSRAIAATKQALLQNFRDHGNCLQTGFLGTSILMDTLTYDVGAPEMAYTLLLQHKNPSWLYSVDQGATTIWERWNSYVKATGFGPVGMNSFNHYAYGAVLAWMYGTMAGIQEDVGNPGFKHIILSPLPDRRIGHVKARYDSAYGCIRSAWEYKENGTWVWTFTIPANTTATVTVPGEQPKDYVSGTYTVKKKF